MSELGSAGNQNGSSGYYDTHSGFPVSSAGTDSILYDSITTISQAQSPLYTPTIGSKFQKHLFKLLFWTLDVC